MPRSNRVKPVGEQAVDWVTRNHFLFAGMVPLLILFLSLSLSAAPIDDFFTRFSTEWVRQDPLLATSSQYFAGAEQQRLDAELPSFTEESARQRIALARKGLVELNRFNRKSLTPTQVVSAASMEWQLRNIIDEEPYLDYTYPFRQFAGLQLALTDALTTTHPIRNRQDAENYIARLRLVASRLDQGIRLAQKRAAKGVIPPRFILTATTDQMNRFIEPSPASNLLVTTFAERIEKIPSITPGTRGDFKSTAEAIVRDSVYPAWRRVIALLESQVPKSTEQAGYWKFPNGAELYAFYLRRFTTTAMTAGEIHETGLKEVARLEREMDEVLRKLGFRDFNQAQAALIYPDSPAVRSQVLADYVQFIRDAEKRSAPLFDLRPKAPVEVRRIPEYRERNTPAHYTLPARDGSRPGIFWAPLPGPTFSRINMRTLAYHEAVPGHHFQLALQQENTELPRFRTDSLLGILSAYAEGWGLYAEQLAAEGNWFEGDLTGQLGYLASQLFRARRLVVDTGLHSKRWTRQQAIDYGISPLEVDRYIVWPGQACSYKIGQLRIVELREKARRAMGPRFDLKQFHNLVLRTGQVPLQVLETVVDRWTASSNQ